MPPALEGQQQLDRIELALIALLNATAQRPTYRPRDVTAGRRVQGETMVDTNYWRHLRLPPRLLEPWLFGWNDADERLATPEPDLLLAPVPQILGSHAAVAFYMGHTAADVVLRYNGLRRLTHLPRPYRCLVPGTLYYVRDVRDIRADGTEVYQQSLHGWHPATNRYVPIGHPEEPWRETLRRHDDKERLVLCASLVEDTQARWAVRVSEVTGVWLSTDGEGIKALAALRDDPRTASGRRAPLLHWVQAHLRRRPGGSDVVEVRRHLRGLTSFRLGTVQVDIHEPRKE
jgi:hypothetical protein